MSKRPGVFSRLKKGLKKITLKKALPVIGGAALLAIPGVGAAVAGGVAAAGRSVTRGALATGKLVKSVAHTAVDTTKTVADEAEQTLSTVADARDAIRKNVGRGARSAGGTTADIEALPAEVSAEARQSFATGEAEQAGGSGIGAVPTWMWLAGGGLLLFLLIRRR